MSITLDQIEDVVWFTGLQPHQIGIILVNTGFGYKSYIGTGAGLNEDYDKMRIAENGSKFHEGRRIWTDIKWWADYPETHPERTDGGRVPINKVVVKYWREFFYTDEHCTICGNHGVIDSRAQTPAGQGVGRANWCICPNGQHFRQLLGGLGPKDEAT